MGKCYYSGTWSWVKPLTIPESPPIDLFNTWAVKVLSSLCAPRAPFLMFFHTEVVKIWTTKVQARGPQKKASVASLFFSCQKYHFSRPNKLLPIPDA